MPTNFFDNPATFARRMAEKPKSAIFVSVSAGRQYAHGILLFFGPYCAPGPSKCREVCPQKLLKTQKSKICSYLKHICKNFLFNFGVSAVNTSDIILLIEIKPQEIQKYSAILLIILTIKIKYSNKIVSSPCTQNLKSLWQMCIIKKGYILFYKSSSFDPIVMLKYSNPPNQWCDRASQRTLYAQRSNFVWLQP